MEKIQRATASFVHYMPLLRELTIRDIKVKYKRSMLGILWTVLNPLLNMVVITFVFSNVFRFNIENYPVYYLTGNILFAFHSEATNLAMRSIIDNAALIKKVYIPKYLFPTSRAVSGFVNLAFSFVALLVVMLFTRTPIQPTILLSFALVPTLFMFSLGLGLILSCAAVFFKDIIYLYGVFLNLWTFVTPIFYPYETVNSNVQAVIRMNPMFAFIKYFRTLCLQGAVPPAQDYFICLLLGVASLTIGLCAFYKCQDRFILYI